jgi:hypothetical protein
MVRNLLRHLELASERLAGVRVFDELDAGEQSKAADTADDAMLAAGPRGRRRARA